MHGRDAFVECGFTPHHADAATTERQRRDRPKLTKAVLPHDCHLPVGLGSQFVANLHVRFHSQEMQYCRRGCFPARPPILVRRWLLICRPRRRRETRPAADPGLRNALTVSSSSASPCVAEVTRTERPRMRDVSCTAEE